MKQKRCTELQIPHSNSQRLEHIKQYRRMITHRASLSVYFTTKRRWWFESSDRSNGQTRPIRKFSNRPITVQSNRIGTADSNSNRISKLRRFLVNISLTITVINRNWMIYSPCRASLHSTLCISQQYKLVSLKHDGTDGTAIDGEDGTASIRV